MAEVFIGSLMLVPYDFEPYGFAFCDGRILQIRQNTALFALIGNRYGGDGVNTFALPDLRGRIPISYGQGPGLSNYALAAKAGAETAGVTVTQVAPHNHVVNGTAAGHNVATANNNLLARAD